MKKYLFKRWKENIFLILLILLGGLLKVVSAYATGESFNGLLKYDYDKFIYFILISLGCFLFFLFTLLIKIPYESYVIQKMITDIRYDITKSIEKQSYKSYHENGSGVFISWLSNDLNLIEQKGFTSFYSLFTMVTETIFAILGLLAFHWSIIVFSILMSIVTIFLPQIVSKKVNKRAFEYSEEYEKFIEISTSLLQGFDTLFSFDMLNILSKNIKKSSKKLGEKSVKLKKIIGVSAVLGGLGNVVSQVGVIALTGFLALKKFVSFGSILTVESLSSTIFNSVGNIINVSIELNTVKPLFEKFESYDKDIDIVLSQNVDMRSDIEEIKLEKLSFKYGNNKILDNISFVFNKGKNYAISGKSGSGKSTLLNILCGKLSGYDGSIKLNNIELSEINLSNLRENILYIDQSPYIFNDTIKFNITLGEDIDDDEVLNVLNKVELKDYLVSLKDGLQTVLSESGKNLSGGQKQRIALARGLIRNKKIILLDEVSSNQDKETALKIENLLLDDENLTVIMITHNMFEENKNKFNKILEL